MKANQTGNPEPAPEQDPLNQQVENVGAIEPPKTLDEYAKAISQAYQIADEADKLSKKKGKEAIAAALKAGQYLIEVKELVPYGNWEKWVKQNCKGIKIRTAQRYMTLARFKNDTVSFLDECLSLRQGLIVSGALIPTQADKPPENREKNGGNEEASETPEIILNQMQRGFEMLQRQFDILTKLAPDLEIHLAGIGVGEELYLREILQSWQYPLSDALNYFNLPSVTNVCVRCGHIRQPNEYFVPIHTGPQYRHPCEWCMNCEMSYEERYFTKALKELTGNLNELKSLNVKDYTLALKLDQLKHIAVAKKSVIKAVEDNEWAPADIKNEGETVAAIQRLSPKIVIARDAATKKRWDIYRHFVSSAVYNPTPGRWIKFLVVDDSQSNKPVLGIGAISGDFPALERRDEFIGWSKEQREKKRSEGGKLSHIAVASTIVPTRIFGPNFNGGKLIAALTTSQPIRDEWKSCYKDTLVGMTTTSLFGVPSIYDRIQEWKRLGLTTGRVPIQPKLEIYRRWLEFLKDSRKYEFKQMMKQDDDVSGPVTNYKTKVLTMIYKAAGLNLGDFMHRHERGIYFSEFYENTRDFLCGKVPEDDLKMKPLFQETVQQITERWRIKAIKRYQNLKAKGELKPGKQSYSQLGQMDFETARKTFLDDVDQ